MAEQEQTPIGDNVEIPAGESREYVYVSPGDEFVSVVELVAANANVIEASVRVDQQRAGEPLVIPERPTDGDDSKADSASVNPEKYPIDVSTIIGNTRFTTTIKLEEDDRVVVGLKNTDGTNAQGVRFKVMAASTVRAAFGGGR